MCSLRSYRSESTEAMKGAKAAGLAAVHTVTEGQREGDEQAPKCTLM